MFSVIYSFLVSFRLYLQRIPKRYAFSREKTAHAHESFSAAALSNAVQKSVLLDSIASLRNEFERAKKAAVQAKIALVSFSVLV